MNEERSIINKERAQDERQKDDRSRVDSSTVVLNTARFHRINHRGGHHEKSALKRKWPCRSQAPESMQKQQRCSSIATNVHATHRQRAGEEHVQPHAAADFGAEEPANAQG